MKGKMVFLYTIAYFIYKLTDELNSDYINVLTTMNNALPCKNRFDH